MSVPGNLAVPFDSQKRKLLDAGIGSGKHICIKKMPLVMLSHAPHIRTAVALRKKRRTYLSADGCCYVNQSFLVHCPKE